MKIEDIKPKMRVIYIPGIAKGDWLHPACERGVVSSKNSSCAFVRFDGQLGDTNPACDPADLVEG